MPILGLTGFGGGVAGAAAPPLTLSQFWFGSGSDGSFSATGGTVTLATHPTPVAPGGACASLRVASLSSTSITTVNPNSNKFAVGDRIMLYQWHTNSPNAPKSGNYSIHTIASIPNSTTINIGGGLGGQPFQPVYPGTDTITTANYVTGTAPFPSTSETRCYVVRMAQFTTFSMPGGPVTATSDTGDNCGVIAILASTSAVINGGTLTALGFGKSGGLGAPSSGSPSSPNCGGKGDSYDGTFNYSGQPAYPGSGNQPAYGIGGGGGNHQPGSRSGGGGGGAAYNSGFEGGQDNSGARGLAGVFIPSPLRDIPGSNKLFAGGGGGGGSDTVGTPGGKGGGIILLFSPTITISSGSITARGAETPTFSGSGTDSGGGGGGGHIILRGQTVSLGTNLVTAKGGDQGGSYSPAGWGGAGGGGCVSVYAPSITGSLTNTSVESQSQNPVYYNSPFTV